MYAAHQKGTYQNFRHSLTVPGDVSQSHDANAKWETASETPSSSLYRCTVCLQTDCNPSSFKLLLLSCSDTERLVHV